MGALRPLAGLVVATVTDAVDRGEEELPGDPIPVDEEGERSEYRT
jgi:hypothetical protein